MAFAPEIPTLSQKELVLIKLFQIGIENGLSLKDIKILKSIAECESGLVHYKNNGEILKGYKNPNDSGLFQINAVAHANADIDFTTLDGNIQYAIQLYKKNGTRDWRYSRACWSKKVLTKLKNK